MEMWWVMVREMVLVVPWSSAAAHIPLSPPLPSFLTNSIHPNFVFVLSLSSLISSTVLFLNFEPLWLRTPFIQFFFYSSRCIFQAVRCCSCVVELSGDRNICSSACFKTSGGRQTRATPQRCTCACARPSRSCTDVNSSQISSWSYSPLTVPC